MENEYAMTNRCASLMPTKTTLRGRSSLIIYKVRSLELLVLVYFV